MAEIRNRITLDGADTVRASLDALARAAQAFAERMNALRSDGLDQTQQSAEGARTALLNVKNQAVATGATLNGAFQNASDNVTKTTNSLGSLVSRLVEVGGKAVLAVGAVTAAAAVATSALANSAAKSVTAISESAEALGLTVEQFQRLQNAAASAGVSQEKFATGVGSLRKAYDQAIASSREFQNQTNLIETTYDKLGVTVRSVAGEQDKAQGPNAAAVELYRRLGISLVDAGGRAKDFGLVVAQTRDAFSRLSPAQQAALQGSAKFGETIRQLGPFLKAGRQDIADYNDAWDKSGRGITEAEASVGIALTAAQADLSDALKATGDKIGLLFVPNKTLVAEFITEFVDRTRDLTLEFAKLQQSRVAAFAVDNLPAFVQGLKDIGRTITSISDKIGPTIGEIVSFVRDLTNSAFKTVAEQLTQITGIDISETFVKATTAVLALTGGLSGLSAAFTPVVVALTALTTLFGGLGPLALAALLAVTGFWDEMVDGAAAAAIVFDAFRKDFGLIARLLARGEVHLAWEVFKLDARQAFDEIKKQAPAFAAVLIGIGDIFTSLGKSVRGFAGTVNLALANVAGTINVVFGTELTGKSLGAILVLAQLTGTLNTLGTATFIVANLIRALGLQISFLVVALFNLQRLGFVQVIQDIGKAIVAVFTGGDISGAFKKLKDDAVKAFTELGDAGVRTWAVLAIGFGIAALKILEGVGKIRLALKAVGLLSDASGVVSGAAAAAEIRTAFATGGAAAAAEIRAAFATGGAAAATEIRAGAATGAAGGGAVAAGEGALAGGVAAGATAAGSKAGLLFRLAFLGEIALLGGLAFAVLSGADKKVEDDLRQAIENNKAASKKAEEEIANQQAADAVKNAAPTDFTARTEEAKASAAAVLTDLSDRAGTAFNEITSRGLAAADKITESFGAAKERVAAALSKPLEDGAAAAEAAGQRVLAPLARVAEAARAAGRAFAGISKEVPALEGVKPNLKEIAKDEEDDAEEADAAEEAFGKFSGTVRSFSQNGAKSFREFKDGVEVATKATKDVSDALPRVFDQRTFKDFGQDIDAVVKKTDEAKDSAKSWGEVLDQLVDKFKRIAEAQVDQKPPIAPEQIQKFADTPASDFPQAGAPEPQPAPKPGTFSTDALRPSSNIEDRRPEFANDFQKQANEAADAFLQIRSIAQDTFQKITDYSEQTTGLLTKDIQGLADVFAKVFQGIFDNVKTSVTPAFDAIIEKIASVRSALVAAKQDAPDVAQPAATEAPRSLFSEFDQQAEADKKAKAAAATTEQAPGTLFDGLLSSAQAAIPSVVQTVQDGVAQILAALNEIPTAFSTVFDGVVQTAEQALSRIADKIAALKDALPSFSSSAPPASADAPGGFADGGLPLSGLLRGPGSETSDSMIVRVSTDEFITRAKAVRFYGPDFFHALNQMRIPLDAIRRFATGGLPLVGRGLAAALPALPAMIGASLATTMPMPAFAEGGIVATAAAPASSGSGAPHVLNLSLPGGEKLQAQMTDAQFERAQKSFLARKTLRQA